jgi:hypothetical protein
MLMSGYPILTPRVMISAVLRGWWQIFRSPGFSVADGRLTSS